MPVPVTGSVGISGTPSVTVTNQVGVTGTVGIDPLANNVKITAGAPWVYKNSINLGEGTSSAAGDAFMMGDGVSEIDTIAFSCNSTTSPSVHPYIQIWWSIEEVLYLYPQFQPSPGGTGIIGLQTVKIRLPSGSGIVAGASRKWTETVGEAECTVQVCGHYVP